MAIELVDATQLDSDLTDIADAIRLKGGTSASLAFPSDFISAINAISGGGSDTRFKDLIDGTLSVINDSEITNIAAYAFYNNKSLTSVQFSECTQFYGRTPNERQFYGCSNLTTAIFPKLTSVSGYCFQGCTSLETVSMPTLASIGGDTFNGCTSLEKIAFPQLSNNGANGNNYLRNCTKLKVVDLGGTPTMIGGHNNFNGDTLFDTLILRNTSVIGLNNINNFTGTPFASGGTGGTIYIPKSLYDHLGDNSTSDYKAKANWTTIDGYGTITWAQIEGSYYETHYGDDTLIS